MCTVRRCKALKVGATFAFEKWIIIYNDQQKQCFNTSIRKETNNVKNDKSLSEKLSI